MQDGTASCHPEFEEELIALLSIYDSELQVERKASGGVSLHMKMSPAPPVYIKASVTLHIPAAVRSRFLFSSRHSHSHLLAGRNPADTHSAVRYIQSAPRAPDSEYVLSHELLQVGAVS